MKSHFAGPIPLSQSGNELREKRNPIDIQQTPFVSHLFSSPKLNKART
jgi:hypothetical protein